MALEETQLDTLAATQYVAQKRVEPIPSEFDSNIDTKKFEAAMHKVLHGNARTGHRVLRSSGLHPATPETVELLRGKLITD